MPFDIRGVPAACALASAGLFLSLSGPAGAEDPPSDADLAETVREQGELIEAQRAELERLQRRVDALEGETVFEAEGAAEAEAEAKAAARRAEVEAEAAREVERDLERRRAALEAREATEAIVPVAVHRETDRMKPGQGVHLALPKVRTKVTVSGFVKLDVIHDFREINSPAKFISTEIVVPGSAMGQTTISANVSRLIVGSASASPLGRVTTFLSMDFFANPLGRSPDPRLRQAWGQIDDLRFGGGLRAGQSWSTWDDVPSLPETLDFEGPNGSDQTRHPLVRWIQPAGEHVVFWLAIEDPESTINGGESETRSPDGVVSATWSGDWGHVKPAVMLRDLGASDGGGVARAFGWGAQASGLIKLPWWGGRDDFRFQIQYGEGIGIYVNDSTEDAVLSGGTLFPLPVFTGYAAVRHWWCPTVRSSAVFGWIDFQNLPVQGPDALDNALYAAGNLIWSPIEQLDVGVEVLWGRRRNKDGQSGYDPRLQFSAKFSF